MNLASQIRVKHAQVGQPERTLTADIDFYCPPHLASYTFTGESGSPVGSVIVPRTLSVPNVAQWVARELEHAIGGRVEVADGRRSAK